jgi:hypothetical protein
MRTGTKGYLFIFCEMAVGSMLDSLDRVHLKCLNYYINILFMISNNYMENVYTWGWKNDIKCGIVC